MTTTELNNAKTNPGKLTFGRAVKAVLLFPFKVLWFALKVALVLVLAGVVTTVGYGVYRSGQPMVVPEAQGMTYREFLKERMGAMKALDDARLANGEERRVCLNTDVFFTLPALFFYAAPQHILAVLYPNTNFARAVEGGNHYYYRDVPTASEPKWRNVLPLYWEAVERQSWTFLVIRGAKSYNCPMPPVTYPETISTTP
ncbi:MAG: hypothetical protein HPY85_10460 [Anaerolineae bacterium]|nr:hypothetical protein [Anaerolineae bacterium]